MDYLSRKFPGKILNINLQKIINIDPELRELNQKHELQTVAKAG